MVLKLIVDVSSGFRIDSESGRSVYALVVGTHDAVVDYITVGPIYRTGRRDVRCYDDEDAIKEQDEHHVQLDSCPPPFSVFGYIKNQDGKTKSNIVAFADMSNVKTLPIQLFENGTCKIIDNGKKVSEKDIDTIYNHPWASRMHYELLKKDFTELTKEETTKHAFGTYNGRKLPKINKTNDSDDLEYE